MTQFSHLVCPHCQAINRIPSEKLSEHPNCGKCKSTLLTQHPVALTDTTLLKTVQKNGVLTIVDFWASWCQPCLMMAPQFEQAAGQLPEVVFAKLQTDKFEQAASPFNIRSLPTMVAFRGGKEVARQSGLMQSGQIVQWIQSLK